MKKIALAGLAGMLLVSASVNAMSISGQAGKEYTNIGVGFGTESTGLALSGLQWKIGNSFRLFGEYYYSPDSLSSGIQSYEEANAGARYTIMRPVSIEAGYRYLNLSGKDGNRDNAVADGPYVGVNASF
ncbi:hypothetical protein FHR02_09660 [Escherichia coli]|nr:hypothetical protein [Escherichia coli]